MHSVRTIALCVHVLAGSAWFGAMFYSLFVLQPRAQKYFHDPQEFEGFVRMMAAGARWSVLIGCLIIGGSGIALLLLPHANLRTTVWWGHVVTKTILFVLAVGLFCYVSWKLWPDRLFASNVELPLLQRKFRIIGFALLTLVALCMILGLLGRFV